MYNKNNLAIAKVASQSNIRPEMACVAFYGDRTVATDTYRLIEMSASGEKKDTPELYLAEQIKTIKLKKGETLDDPSRLLKPADVSNKYPDIDVLFKETDAQEFIELKINAEYLQEVCAILKELDPFKTITLKMPKNSVQRPIVITAEGGTGESKQTARALIMPMNPRN